VIRIRIVRDKQHGAVCAFTVDGHAQYADAGQDIVCAGVSAVTIGTIHALEKLLRVGCDTDTASGKLHVQLPHFSIGDARVQLLVSSMVVMLRSIEETYGAYVRIDDTISRKEKQ
jgi:uncharacterized protein YsxB (DUF464 family)